MPTKAQLTRARAVVDYVVRDPLDGRRRCRWCGLDAPAHAQDGGEYLCPADLGGCGRWQHARAFPDGVPGLTQDALVCRRCGATTHYDAAGPAPDACPACGEKAV